MPTLSTVLFKKQAWKGYRRGGKMCTEKTEKEEWLEMNI